MHMLSPRILPERSGPFRPSNRRRVLCVFPRYANSFGTFQYAYPLMPRVRAFMPPQGILVIAAYLPREWDVRFVDENIRPAGDDDFAWADVVFISGMHVQRRRIDAINRGAHRHGKLTILGGPSVSGCPDYYPEADVLHVGEIGDATDAIIRMIDKSVDRPRRQIVFETADRLPLEGFPVPAYHLLDMRQYFLGSIQFSSGCPFLCEFCDIPALYGRSPRTKSPRQVLSELDAMVAAGVRGAIYFVDDNFIGNPAAARGLLPHLIEWQRRSGYLIRFSCEATLNITQFPDVLALMREAHFTAMFVGIETPEAEALALIQKKQNARQPILGSVKTLNDHGIEVVSGIILGLDNDTPRTGDAVLGFIEASRIPMLTINLLYALPRTKLHERLSAAGRLIDDPARESNVVFKMPYPVVLNTWRRVVREAYDSARLFGRFESQTEVCFPNRFKFKRTVTPKMVSYGANVIARTLWQVGYRADYADLFWKVSRPLIARKRIEEVIHIGVVTHHLIQFARDCEKGSAEACFYADPNRAAEPVAAAG